MEIDIHCKKENSIADSLEINISTGEDFLDITFLLLRHDFTYALMSTAETNMFGQ
jgi:hypothetical protein